MKVQKVTDTSGKELNSAQIKDVFDATYLNNTSPLSYVDHGLTHQRGHHKVQKIEAGLLLDGHAVTLVSEGNGPIDALMHGLQRDFGIEANVMSYNEHALSVGEDSSAITYVQMRFGWDQSTFGVGIDANIVTAALKAIIAGLNRGIELGYLQKPVVGGGAKVVNG